MTNIEEIYPKIQQITKCKVTELDNIGEEQKQCIKLPLCSKTYGQEANTEACVCLSPDGTKQTTCDTGTGLYCSKEGDFKADSDEFGTISYKGVPVWTADHGLPPPGHGRQSLPDK